MGNWREELIDVVKSQAEREAEEEARKAKRLAEALKVAEEALQKATDGLRFTNEQLKSKSQPAKLEEKSDDISLMMNDLSLSVGLSRSDAVLKVVFNEGRPREFDFAKDRHLSAKDVEEYVGRRAVEFARAAQKSNPW
jgi:hypothetical protein